MADWDLEIARQLLKDWARWLLNAGGYAHQSSLETLKQGGGGGQVFRSSVPLDVEPSASVSVTSRAMQHLQAFDPEAALLLHAIYLRKQPQRMQDIAYLFDVGKTTLQARRQAGERKFLELVRALEFPR